MAVSGEVLEEGVFVLELRVQPRALLGFSGGEVGDWSATEVDVDGLRKEPPFH